MNRSISYTMLLYSSLVLYADNQIQISLLDPGTNTIFSHTINLNDTEQLSGKTFGALLKEAKDKKVPRLLVTTLLLREEGPVLGCLDGYTILLQPPFKTVEKVIRRHVQDNATTITYAQIMLLYPEGFYKCITFDNLDTSVMHELDSIAHIYFNGTSSEREKLAHSYAAKYQTRTNMDPITTARIAKFWLEQQVDSNKFDPNSQTLQEIKTYLAQQATH